MSPYCIHPNDGWTYVGNERVCNECFMRRLREIRLENAEEARRLTMPRILPWNEALAVQYDNRWWLPTGAVDEVRDDALRALMETPYMTDLGPADTGDFLAVRPHFLADSRQGTDRMGVAPTPDRSHR